MRLMVIPAVAIGLFLGRCAWAHEGGGHGGDHGGDHGGHHGHHDEGGGTSVSSHHGPYPLLILVWVPGREIASSSASSGWLYVEPPSQESIARQKTRDDSFRTAVADWEARNGHKIYED